MVFMCLFIGCPLFTIKIDRKKKSFSSNNRIFCFSNLRNSLIHKCLFLLKEGSELFLDQLINGSIGDFFYGTFKYIIGCTLAVK